MVASYAFDVSAQRKPAPRHASDRSRTPGRYDAGRTPLPPGGQLATMPREENRAALQARLEAVRKRIHRAPSAPQLAALREEEQRLLQEKEAAPGKAVEKKLRAVRERLGNALTSDQAAALRDDERRLTAALAAMGESLAAVGIVDPMGDGRATLKASVNRQTDILEMERSHGRISDAAYRAGRTVQDVLEKVGRIGGSGWDMSRGDRSTTQGNAVARAMEQAQDTRRMLGFIEGRLGMIDARLIRRVLGEGMMHADQSRALEKAGIAVTFVHAGARKVEGNSFQPLGADTKKRMQAEVDGMREDFVQAVATGRRGRISAKAIRDTEAGVFTGREAKGLGLVDELASFDDLYAEMKQGTAVRRGPAPAPAGKRKATMEELSSARVEATIAERTRISAILNAPEAKGQEAQARRLALETFDSATVAIAALRASAEVSRAKTTLNLDEIYGRFNGSKPQSSAVGSDSRTVDHDTIYARRRQAVMPNHETIYEQLNAPAPRRSGGPAGGSHTTLDPEEIYRRRNGS